MRQRRGVIYGDGTIAALQRDGEILAAAAFADFGLVGAVPENGGVEFRIENGTQDTMLADQRHRLPYGRGSEKLTRRIWMSATLVPVGPVFIRSPSGSKK